MGGSPRDLIVTERSDLWSPKSYGGSRNITVMAPGPIKTVELEQGGRGLNPGYVKVDSGNTRLSNHWCTVVRNTFYTSNGHGFRVQGNSFTRWTYKWYRFPSKSSSSSLLSSIANEPRMVSVTQMTQWVSRSKEK